ncbi:hypothetical protein SpCBS45565_g07784 [Spizellomyces sp. 'palustris']|nr:hypothetical protein SpCBS45565_g07784 [Spizellomyces sp. 'palustris']
MNHLELPPLAHVITHSKPINLIQRDMFSISPSLHPPLLLPPAIEGPFYQPPSSPPTPAHALPQFRPRDLKEYGDRSISDSHFDRRIHPPVPRLFPPPPGSPAAVAAAGCGSRDTQCSISPPFPLHIKVEEDRQSFYSPQSRSYQDSPSHASPRQSIQPSPPPGLPPKARTTSPESSPTTAKIPPVATTTTNASGDTVIVTTHHNGTTKHSKLYRCPSPNCSKMFTRRYNLQSHMRCHSGERPFVCRYCGTTFSRKHDLRRHTRSLHSEDRPHHCGFCSLSFARSDALKRHLASEAKRCSSHPPYPPNPNATDSS